MRRQRRPRTYKIKFSRGTESAQATRCHIISVNYTYIQIITCKWGFDLDSRYLWQADTGLICCLDSKVDNYETNPQKPGITCGNTDSDTQLFVVEYLLLVGAFFFYFFLDLKGLYWNAFFHFNTTLYFISIQLFPLSVFMSEFNFFSLHLVRHLNTFTVKTTPSMATLAT